MFDPWVGGRLAIWAYFALRAVERSLFFCARQAMISFSSIF